MSIGCFKIDILLFLIKIFGNKTPINVDSWFEGFWPFSKDIPESFEKSHFYSVFLLIMVLLKGDLHFVVLIWNADCRDVWFNIQYYTFTPSVPVFYMSEYLCLQRHVKKFDIYVYFSARITLWWMVACTRTFLFILHSQK